MLNRTENWLRKAPNWLFVGLLILIALAKVGPSPIGAPWVEWLYQAARSFPKAANYISYSPAPTLIAKLLHEPRHLFWWGLWALVLGVWVLVVARRIEVLFPKNYRIIQIIFFASQVLALQLVFIGHYDNISVIAASMVYLYESEWLIYLGGILAAGANPYMSFATGICVLFLYFGTNSRRHLRIGLIWSLISGAMLIFLHIIMTAPSSGTRESIVLGQISAVVRGAFGVWGFIALATMGPLWFVYGWALHSIGVVGWVRRTSLVTGTIGIPILMSFFILDHTRIGVVVGSLPLFLFLLPQCKKIFAKNPKFFELDSKVPAMSLMLLMWILYPTVIVDTGGVFRLPYVKFISLFFGH